MSALPLRVVKVGGSLLLLPDLPSRLREWLTRQSAACNVLVIGGGPLVDTLREADRLHGLGEETSHWLAIRAMGITARMVAALLPEAVLLENIFESIVRFSEERLLVVEPLAILQEPAAALPIPHHWQVTSDSIAAQLAFALHAHELVLIKSRLPAPGSDTIAAAATGYVDGYFPRAAELVSRIRCVNLRHVAFAEQFLRQP